VDPRWLPIQYQVIKGYEYTIVGGELDARAARRTFTIPLSRWSAISAAAGTRRQPHSPHLAKTCRLEMDAEDLNVANILTSDFTRDQAEFEGRLNKYSGSHSLIYVNQEFRNNHWSHVLLNLKEPIQRWKRCSLIVTRCTHRSAIAPMPGRLRHLAHFPSMPALESPLDVALGKLDGLEILCVLEPRELPVFVKKLVPEMSANSGLRMWYRYLNCGFPLTATAAPTR